MWELANAKSIGQADKLEIQVRVDIAELGLKSTKQETGNSSSLPWRSHFLKIILFIYLFWLCWVSLLCRLFSSFSEKGFSLLARRGGFSLIVVHGLLIAVASLVAEHGL